MPLAPGLQRLNSQDAVRLFGGEDAAHAYEFVGIPPLDQVNPRELEVVARAVERRLHTFAAGRLCAHAALADKGAHRAALLPDASGQPDWPAEALGSIAHTDGYAIAAVLADPGLHVGLGVDAEALGAVNGKVSPAIFTEAERAYLASLDIQARTATATLIFCAKDAFYKAQFRLTGVWINFHDVEARVKLSGVLLHPVSDLKALAAFRWPLGIGHTLRGCDGRRYGNPGGAVRRFVTAEQRPHSQSPSRRRKDLLIATAALAPSPMATDTSRTSRDTSPATYTPGTLVSSVAGSVTTPPFSSRLQPSR
jgi:4'-phosphopantetheinyl transferase EntD